jgi:hypothetical protein
MSQPPEPTPSRPVLPADLPWGIHYLREDIQDLKHDIRRLETRLDATNQRIDDKHEHQLNRLDNRFMWIMTTMITLTGVLIAVIKL